MNNMANSVLIATLMIAGILSIAAIHPVYAEAAYAKGQVDATRDFHGLNGHGYDDSCPSGHSAQYCANYKDGYATQWAVSANDDLINGDHGIKDVDSQSQGGALGGNKINGDDNTINQQIIQQQGSGSGSGDSLSHCKAFCVN